MSDLLDLVTETPAGRLGITGYRPGAFRVGPDWHEGSLLLLPDGVASWPIAAPADVTLDSLDAFRDLEPKAEILLLGMGDTAPLLPFELRQALRGWGLSVEAMPTPSACRTFNLLLIEERRVVAALCAMP